MQRLPSTTWPVLSTVVLCSLPHLLIIHPLMVASTILLWLLAVLIQTTRFPAPGPILRSILGLLLFAGAVYLHQGLTVDAFVALLISMIGLKLFERTSRRDAIVTVILCYFLIVSGMFFSDSLLATGLILFTIVFNTAVLQRVQFPLIPLAKALRQAGRLFLQALPITLVLFLFFPRIQGGFWGRPSTVAARSGFSEEIQLGTVARLAQDEKVAFRVNFDTTYPREGTLYWRGIVLSRVDGSSWKLDWHGRQAKPISLPPQALGYTLTLEPHHQRWFFSLDLPLTRPEDQNIRLLTDHTLFRWKPVQKRMQYHLFSNPSASPEVLAQEWQTELRLPDRGNPRARRLATQWRNQRLSDQAIVTKGLELFRKGGYRYTLQPGQVAPERRDDAIDAFLFDHRRGFCEHFAASYAYLMRAAGVPARLVGGYLGGSWNTLGEYLVVRQSDAHVWCEVLLKGQGWQRIDPTLIVAPHLIDNGGIDVRQVHDQESLLTLLGLPGLPSWFKRVQEVFDLMNSHWNQWVMSYSVAEQMRLFSGLGINLHLDAGLAQAAVLALICMVAAITFGLTLLKRRPPGRDPVAEHWIRFNRLMARLGLPRRPDQGPLEYLTTIERLRPELSPQVEPIIRDYIALRYQEIDDRARLASFCANVRRFRPHPGKAPVAYPSDSPDHR